MGNICRSPTAEGVMLERLRRCGLEGVIEVDSAGTHAYHVGEPPDRRAQQSARRRGIELGGQRARQVTHADFARFDHVLAMDSENLALLAARCPPEHAGKLRLLLDCAPELGVRDVPDPYYGAGDGFERVLDMLEAAVDGLLGELRGSG
jgi:protein-tyrosine phosphatase